MKYIIIIQELAKKDLLNVFDYIYYILKNPISAKRIGNYIINSIDSLSDNPYRHRVIINNIRFLKVKNFIIYYYVNNEIVYVLRILGNKQQFNYYDVLN